MLRAIIRILSNSTKICLFVDGLDEFDGHHEDLICLFRDLIDNPNTKLCVSSRPWVVFEDAFRHKPSLRLQDLTYSDIQLYVNSCLYDNPGFVQLTRREPAYADQLADNIIRKASGVFLWVNLVVASLLAGMSYGDRISDLQRRLEALPPDLELLYEKILLSLDPFYLEHAAQLFKLVQASLRQPSLLMLSFADEEDPQCAIDYPIQTLSDAEILLRSDTMRRRLNSRYKGFLEVGSARIDVQSGDDHTVQYLHRTVKDYVESQEAQRILELAMKTPFDPHLRIFMGSLAHIKVIDVTTNFFNEIFWVRAQQCLYSASRIKATHDVSVVAYLDELSRTGSCLLKQASQSKLFKDILEVGQVSLWPILYPLRFGNLIRFGGTFLSVMVHYGIVDFVRERAEKGCLVKPPYYPTSELWPLLVDAVVAQSSPGVVRHKVGRQSDMIACLLQKGADPNFLIPGGTGRSVWPFTLTRIMKDYDGRSLKAPWPSIACMMIDHGANMDKDMFASLTKEIYGQPLKWKGIKPEERGWIEKLLFRELLIIWCASKKARSTCRVWI